MEESEGKSTCHPKGQLESLPETSRVSHVLSPCRKLLLHIVTLIVNYDGYNSYSLQRVSETLAGCYAELKRVRHAEME